MENLLHQTLDFDSEASESRSAYQPSPNAVLAKKNGIRSSRNCASATGKNNQNASKSIHPKNEDFADFCQKRLKRFQILDWITRTLPNGTNTIVRKSPVQKLVFYYSFKRPTPMKCGKGCLAI